MNYKYIKFLGFYQIIGGISGFLVVLYKLNAILLTSSVFFGFSIICSLLLVKNKLKKGLNLSILNQAIQVIGFSILGFSYRYISGLDTGFYLDLTSDFITGLSINLTTWIFNIKSNSDLIFLNINIIPIILLNFIYKQKERLEKERNELKTMVSN